MSAIAATSPHGAVPGEGARGRLRELLGMHLSEFARCAGGDPGDGAWELRPGGDEGPVLRVFVDGEWLCFTTALAHRGRHPAALLRASAMLPAGLKFTLPEPGPVARLQAELPWRALLEAHPGAFAARIAALRAGVSPVLAGRSVRRARRAGPPRVLDAARAGVLADSLVQAGWSPIAGKGPLRVELATGGPYQVASFEPRAQALRVATEIARDQLPGSTPAGRRAVALLALRAGASLRLCRPVLRRGADVEHLEFEVLIDERPCEAELEHALAALSVACRHHAREAEALAADPGIAEHYLRLAAAGRPSAGPPCPPVSSASGPLAVGAP